MSRSKSPKPPEAPTIVKSTAIRDPLRYNFKNYLYKTWRTIGLPDPTPIQYDMADYLQDKSRDRLEVMGFRGAAKSYITVTYSLFELRNDRDLKALLTSATAGFARTNAQFALQMILGFDWLEDMKPSPEQRMAATSFDVGGAVPAKDASFVAEGIFGQLTGRRADLAIQDDVETPNTSSNDADRAELRKRVGEIGGAILKPGGRSIFLGTAQTEETLYLEQERKGYCLRLWPLLYPTPKEMVRYGSRLAPKLVEDLKANPNLAGTSTEPSRFDEMEIDRKLLEFGSVEFDRQMKLFLDIDGAQVRPLKLKDAIVVELSPSGNGKAPHVPAAVQWSPSPETQVLDIAVDGPIMEDKVYWSAIKPDQWGPAEGVWMRVDPSGDGKDETTWTIGGHRYGYAYLFAQRGDLRGHDAEVMDEIAKDALKWGVNYIRVESQFGQGMFGTLLQPVLMKKGVAATVEDVPAKPVQKEKRIIASCEPVLSRHKLIINAQVLRDDYDVKYTRIAEEKWRNYRLTYQLSRLTGAKGCLPQDDRIDGLGALLDDLKEFLQPDEDEAAGKHKAEALEAEIDKLIEYRRQMGLPLHGLKQGEGFSRGSPRKLR